MPSKYDPVTRGKAVRLVLDHRGDYPSEWATIKAVSSRLGVNAETLRNWIRQQQVDDGHRDGISSEAAKEIRDLKRRNAELEQTPLTELRREFLQFRGRVEAWAGSVSGHDRRR